MSVSYMLLPYLVFFLFDYAINWIGNSTTKPANHYRPNTKLMYSAHTDRIGRSSIYKILFIGQKEYVCLWNIIGQITCILFLIFYLVICFFFADFAEERYKIILAVHAIKIFAIIIVKLIDFFKTEWKYRKTQWL